MVYLYGNRIRESGGDVLSFRSVTPKVVIIVHQCEMGMYYVVYADQVTYI